jgi:hypothetical protein
MFLPTFTDGFRNRLTAAATEHGADDTTTSEFVEFVASGYHLTSDFERIADLGAIWAAFTHVASRPFDSRVLIAA